MHVRSGYCGGAGEGMGGVLIRTWSTGWEKLGAVDSAHSGLYGGGADKMGGLEVVDEGAVGGSGAGPGHFANKWG